MIIGHRYVKKRIILRVGKAYILSGSKILIHFCKNYLIQTTITQKLKKIFTQFFFLVKIQTISNLIKVTLKIFKI